MIQQCMAVFLRAETAAHEYRAPIVPRDVLRLVDSGIPVYVQSCRHRAFSDQEYQDAGAVVTMSTWYETRRRDGLDPDYTLILGLKSIDVAHLHRHHHMYFSHSYKGQWGATDILEAFRSSGSVLWDMEYFLYGGDANCRRRRRCISFGFYAGVCGCILGLLQYVRRKEGRPPLSSLVLWTSYESAMNHLCGEIFAAPTTLDPAIAIVGCGGECARGVRHVLDYVGLSSSATLLGRNDAKKGSFAITFNCIKLDPKSSEQVWDQLSTEIMVDISCDVTKDNHPMRHLYTEETTWENPVRRCGTVDVICISNLPSLLPRDSSADFSTRCTSLLISDTPENESCWTQCHDAFVKRVWTSPSTPTH
jgi:saccharopine dehydrogenase (NAD+, L-lysine-forming)